MVATIVGAGVKYLVEIEIEAGKVVATAGHPFWLPDEERWADASELRAGSVLQTSAGTSVEVSAVKKQIAITRVYNLTIDDIHTYYVRAGERSVLVHNIGGCKTFGNQSPTGRLDIPETQGVYIIKMKEGMVYVGSATKKNTIHR